MRRASLGSLALVLLLAGSAATAATPVVDRYPGWSPDGRWIDYCHSWKSGVICHANLITPDGRSRRPLGQYNVYWAPNGRRFALVDPSGLRIASPYTPGTASILDGFRPSWSPTSRQLVVQKLSDGLALVDVPSGRVHDLRTNLADCAGCTNRYAPAWSPDGRSIAFLAGPSGDTEITNPTPYGVYVLDLGSKTLRRASSTGACPLLGTVAWSPDSRYVLFLSADCISGSYRGHLVRLSDGHEEDVIPGEHPDEMWFDFAPRGSTVAVLVETRSKQFSLLIRDLSSDRIVTIRGAADFSWAPDGEHLTVEIGGVISRTDARTGRLIKLVAGRQPRWSPTGDAIAYVAPACGGIHVLTLSARRDRQLTRPCR